MARLAMPREVGAPPKGIPRGRRWAKGGQRSLVQARHISWVEVYDIAFVVASQTWCGAYW